MICLAALALRLLIPTGYMVSIDRGRIVMTLCSGLVEQRPTAAMNMSGMDHAMPHEGKSKGHGKTEMPCAFAGLSTKTLGGVDPILLVLALALVATMALRTAPRDVIPAAPYLRPPLRGPPLVR